MTDVEEDGVLVVGASIAGARTAAALRRQGWTGRITLIGDEAHWPPVDRPPLSKGVLTGAQTVNDVRLRLPAVDAEVVLGRTATSLNLTERVVGLDDGTSVRYDHLVIATGAAPRRLGPDRAWLHVLRTAEDAQRLAAGIRAARSVAIVGAGFIGCEVASACRDLGRRTHVVEAAPSPLPPLGGVLGAAHAARMRASGVQLHLAAIVRSLDEVDGRPCVRLDDGSEIDADLVVVGIGVRPNTGWLEGSGLVLDDGVACDAACFALGGDGRIAAVGDVARWEHPAYGSIRIEHWTNAGEQANHVARAIVRGDRAPFAPVPYVWSDQFGSKLQLIGRPAPHDDVAVEEGDPSAGPFVATYRRNGLPTAALCVDAPRSMGRWTTVVTGAMGDLAALNPR
jgi:NADPH-dependent 2,4-dienoyl-CoA reductase/sulfur reductase-like enzyme